MRNIFTWLIFSFVIFGLISCQRKKTRNELLIGEWVLDSVQLSTTQRPEITLAKPGNDVNSICGSNKEPRIIIFNSEGLYFDTLLRPKDAWHWSLQNDTSLILKSFAPAYKHYGLGKIRQINQDNLVIMEVIDVYHESYCICSAKTIQKEFGGLPEVDLVDEQKTISANDLSVDMVRSPIHDSLMRDAKINFNRTLSAVQNDVEDTILNDDMNGYFSKDAGRSWCSKIVIKKVKFFHKKLSQP